MYVSIYTNTWYGLIQKILILDIMQYIIDAEVQILSLDPLAQYQV